jgi:hypothetical protein
VFFSLFDVNVSSSKISQTQAVSMYHQFDDPPHTHAADTNAAVLAVQHKVGEGLSAACNK